MRVLTLEYTDDWVVRVRTLEYRAHCGVRRRTFGVKVLTFEYTDNCGVFGAKDHGAGEYTLLSQQRSLVSEESAEPWLYMSLSA